MVFIVLSTFFIMVFGAEIAYKEIWLTDADEGEDVELIGFPLQFNMSDMSTNVSATIIGNTFLNLYFYLYSVLVFHF